MHQFFVEDEQVGREFITITGSDVNHIRNVLRMKPGEKIRVSSESGRSYFCAVSHLGDNFVQADILDTEAASTELPAKIYLFQALPKGDRMEYVIQKAVELGVYEIIPVAMKYCVVRLDEKKAAAKGKRWQAISESAAKQSKRSRVPKVHPVVPFSEALTLAASCDTCILPYENARGMAPTGEVLDSLRPDTSISVLIGPEGGFAQEEIEAARGKMQLVSLGKRILRTDTAAIAMLSLLMIRLESLELK